MSREPKLQTSHVPSQEAVVTTKVDVDRVLVISPGLTIPGLTNVTPDKKIAHVIVAVGATAKENVEQKTSTAGPVV